MKKKPNRKAQITTITLPGDVREAAKRHGINISKTATRAVRDEVRRRDEKLVVTHDKTMQLLSTLRDRGWSVAVHNDYRHNGEHRTFWLFTHPSGFWAKGEGATDEQALDQVYREAVDREQVHYQFLEEG